MVHFIIIGSSTSGEEEGIKEVEGRRSGRQADRGAGERWIGEDEQRKGRMDERRNKG